MKGLGIFVQAKDDKGNVVKGWLTGTGGGGFTGLILEKEGKDETIAVQKASVKLIPI